MTIKELKEVKGVGEAKARALYDAGFKTIDDIRRATTTELTRAQGIGPVLARKVKEAASAYKAETKEGLRKKAGLLFKPKDKEPYYHYGRVIHDLRELKEKLDEFRVEEAGWLAQWLAYLGDKQTAKEIREHPEQFKRIIVEHYEKLAEYAP